jgi:hypothetical protein
MILGKIRSSKLGGAKYYVRRRHLWRVRTGLVYLKGKGQRFRRVSQIVTANMAKFVARWG